MSLAAFAIQNQIIVGNFVPPPTNIHGEAAPTLRVKWKLARGDGNANLPTGGSDAPTRRQSGDWRSRKPDHRSKSVLLFRL